MHLRKLGRSELNVTELCLGTMQFGWTADEKASFAVMDAYVAAGGNFIDTADIYTTWGPDGMAGAVYQRSTPACNPALPKGEWQSYDITFLAPKFGADGSVGRKPTFTVVFNGVTVQDAVEIDGSTLKRTATLSPHPTKQPIKLQYHNDPIEFRNIWVQELGD